MTDLRPNAGRANERQQVYELADALLCNAITAEEAQRLSKLVCNNAEARRHYVRFMYDSAMLREWREDAPATEAGSGQSTTGNRERARNQIQGPDADNQQSAINDQQSFIPPIVIASSPVADHSLLASLVTPGSFPFSYGVSALVLMIALLVGWGWRISANREQRVVQQTVRQPSAPVPPSAEVPFVGRITGMLDCQWAEPATKAVNRDFVPLGRRYALRSGFLEITYDTGARVILQGPANYEVESTTGGYLSLGKLAARVEKKLPVAGRQSAVSPQPESLFTAHHPLPSDQGSKGERTANLTFSQGGREPTTSLAPRPSPNKSEIRNPKSEISNPQSLIPNPLFVVRTPTALVTDLGTEFGVEVDASGRSRTTVFLGKIEIRPADGGSAPRPVLQLTANQSAESQKGPDDVAKIVRAPNRPNAFVREIPNRATRIGGRAANESHGRPTYRLTDLGTLGGAESYASSINAAGQVAGFSPTARGAMHAFLYSNGAMTDLHTLAGPASTAFAINNHGQVVGDYWPNNRNCHAIFFSAGKMTDLGLLHDGDSFARGINDRGQVVGYWTGRKTGRTRAFLYSNGKMTDLGALGANSYASDINAAGQVVGYCETADKSRKHAFLYGPGAGMKDLGTLGGRISGALRINDLGQVAGCSSADADAPNGAFFGQRAFLYADGTGMKDLGVLAGGTASCAFGINRKGQVVGDVLDSHAGAILAFLHQPDGTMVDLNAVVDPALGWTLTSAKAINDSGQIAGYGTTPDGNIRAFLLTPLAKARDAGAVGIGAAADVGAAAKLPPQPQTDKPLPQPRPEQSTTRGERRALPMNH